MRIMTAQDLPSPGRQFPGDLKEITREHADRVLGLWASRQLAARLRHARDGKPRPVTQLDTLRVAPGGPRIVLTFERAEPVGRSLAASPVERLGACRASWHTVDLGI